MNRRLGRANAAALVTVPGSAGTGLLARHVLPALTAACLVAACSSQPGCNDGTVRQALDQALDNLFAGSRKMATVDLRIDDIVAVEQQKGRASCKAMLHISVDFLGIQKEERDVTISYLAEVTQQGRILVTITTPP